MTFSEDLKKYQANLRPAMLADLGETLGVSAESLISIGIGWYPAEACWIFPERDDKGKVIGLVRRYKDGKKFCVPGSQRGLTYQLNEDTSDAYIAGPQNWIKVEKAGVVCPICKHGDWCLVSAENPEDPQAVICGRKAEGATKPLGEAGYLHIRRSEGRVSSAGSPLSGSELPVLVVEGQSDVTAAADLGFTAVGKPSASGGLGYLTSLLVGRSVVVIGENDSGAGKLGMEKTFEALRPVISDLTKLMPPKDVKDLREWVRRGLTQEKLLEAVKNGDKDTGSDILEDKSPLAVANLWLRTEKSIGGTLILRKYHKDWCLWDGCRYVLIDEEADVRGSLYRYLEKKKYRDCNFKGEVTIKPFEPNRYKLSDIIDAMSSVCPLSLEPPCWIKDTPMNVGNIMSFRNGLLDVDKWIDAPDMGLLGHTPNYFCFNSLPYAYDVEAVCPTFMTYLEQVFPRDMEAQNLVQEWFGYNLVPSNIYEKLMIFVGRPGSGKGTMITALRSILGPKQIASTCFDELVAQFGLEDLVGKLAVILPDAHSTKRGDAMKALEVLKTISGGDAINIPRKHRTALEDFHLLCRITIGVNDLPDLPDHARSLDRRLLLLHFREDFTKNPDNSLKEKIADEAQGIAMWALEGLRRLKTLGRFTIPSSADQITESFQKQVSPITEFSEDCCDFGVTDRHLVIKQMMYDAWMGWAKAQGLGPSLAYSTRTKFDQRFLSLNPGVIPNRKMLQGIQTAMYLGVRLTDDAVNRYVAR